MAHQQEHLLNSELHGVRFNGCSVIRYMKEVNMNYREESLKKHAEWKGKIETVCRVPTDSREALSLAYTPGVAEPCMEIHADPKKSFDLTRRWNTVAVIDRKSVV